MSEKNVTVKTQGLLFDMDGVLISSIDSVNRCWKRWAAHYGVANADSVQIKHGSRAVDIMLGLRPDFGPEEIRDGLRFIEDMEIDDVADLTVLPGVPRLLAAVPADRWTIVTSATRRLMIARLQAAGLPLPARLVAGDDVVNGKPHPEPYMTGARLLGFAPADCIVVEDAPTGVGSGRAAGSRVLGVLGTHREQELRTSGADWVVTSLARLAVQLREGALQMEFTEAADNA